MIYNSTYCWCIINCYKQISDSFVHLPDIPYEQHVTVDIRVLYVEALTHQTSISEWRRWKPTVLASRHLCLGQRMCLNCKVYSHWPTGVCVLRCVWGKMVFTFFRPDNHVVMKLFAYWKAQKRWLNKNSLPSVPSWLCHLLAFITFDIILMQ